MLLFTRQANLKKHPNGHFNQRSIEVLGSIKRMMNKNSLMAVIGFTLILQAQANDLDLSLGYGVDSNPYKIKQKLGPADTAYTRLNIDGSWSIGSSIKWELQTEIRDYEEDSNFADEFKWGTALESDLPLNWISKRLQWQSKLYYSQRDKSYISKSSGQIGTYKNVSIRDRYDYSEKGFQTGFKWKWSRRFMTQINADVREREYTDYTRLGTSNFDYQQRSLEGVLTWFPARSHRFRLHAEASEQTFSDKRQRTLTGTSIKSTDLAYDEHTYRVDYRWKEKNKFAWTLSGQYTQLRDNGLGYYDNDKMIARTGLRFTGLPQIEWGGQYQYAETQYIKRAQSTQDTSEDTYSHRKTNTLKLFLEFNLKPRTGLDVIWFTDYKIEQHQSDKSDYQFDRSIIETGVKIDFL